jgi:protein-S-isoprenylcysteine O-methyltransferase Ste14
LSRIAGDLQLRVSGRIYWSRLAAAVVGVYVLLVAPPKIGPPWLGESMELTGFVLLVAAAFGRIWCLTYISGKKDSVLLTTGPYSVVRNPLYLFSFLGALGFGMAVENPLLSLVLGTGFAVFYPITVRNEERRLLGHFGEEYGKYCDRTPRWIPDFRLYREPEAITLNPAKIRKGLLDATWFLWAFLFWEVLEECRKTGVLPAWR